MAGEQIRGGVAVMGGGNWNEVQTPKNKGKSNTKVVVMIVLTAALAIGLILAKTSNQPPGTIKVAVDREACSYLKANNTQPISGDCEFAAQRPIRDMMRVGNITIPAQRILGFRDE